MSCPPHRFAIDDEGQGYCVSCGQTQADINGQEQADVLGEILDELRSIRRELEDARRERNMR